MREIFLFNYENIHDKKFLVKAGSKSEWFLQILTFHRVLTNVKMVYLRRKIKIIQRKVRIVVGRMYLAIEFLKYYKRSSIVSCSLHQAGFMKIPAFSVKRPICPTGLTWAKSLDSLPFHSIFFFCQISSFFL